MLELFTVSFFGHRIIYNYREVERKVSNLVRSLIREHDYVDFLIGRDGDFDQIVSSEIRRVKREEYKPNCSLIWVMPYIKAEYIQNQASFESYYDEVEICFESCRVHPKAAIQKRNRRMVDRSDLIVCYVTHNSGGAYQTMRYADRTRKSVVNIASIVQES